MNRFEQIWCQVEQGYDIGKPCRTEVIDAVARFIAEIGMLKDEIDAYIQRYDIPCEVSRELRERLLRELEKEN
jgi:hypothetical protein